MNDNIEQNSITVTPAGLVSRKDAAKFLGYGKRALEEWHRLGKGPASVKVGKLRFYRLTDLQAFVAGEKP